MLQLGFLGTAGEVYSKGGGVLWDIHTYTIFQCQYFPYFTSHTIPGTSSYLHLNTCMAELILKYNHSINRLILQSFNQSINQSINQSNNPTRNQVNLCLLTPIWFWYHKHFAMSIQRMPVHCKNKNRIPCKKMLDFYTETFHFMVWVMVHCLLLFALVLGKNIVYNGPFKKKQTKTKTKTKTKSSIG